MKLNKLIELLKTTDNNLILMVGIVLTGKSTFIKKIDEYINTIISRDEILLELACDGVTYNEAYHSVSQKNTSIVLRERIKSASLTEGNVVIDMMSHRHKARKSHIKSFPNHTKIAVVMYVPTIEILNERNKTRLKEEGKFIPENVIKDMYRTCTSPNKEEGFDYIVYLNEKGE